MTITSKLNEGYNSSRVVIPFDSLVDKVAKDISVEVMPLNLLFSYPEWIIQRNVQLRAKKAVVKDNLSTLRPSHFFVAVGEVTQDGIDKDGNERKKGERYVLDSNTRQYFWEYINSSDNKPTEVVAKVYRGTILELGNIYASYDSPDAVEQAAEVMTGVYKLFDFQPKSPKIMYGSIVTSMNYASIWTPNAPLYGTQKGIWGIEPDNNETKTQAKRWQMAEQFKFWSNEWKYLDSFYIGGKACIIDQPLLMALLIAARAYSKDKNLADLITKLNEKDFNPSHKTPISKIAEAATGGTSDVYVKQSANYDAYTRAFDFYLYWIERYISDPSSEKCKSPHGGYTNKGCEFVEKMVNCERILSQMN